MHVIEVAVIVLVVKFVGAAVNVVALVVAAADSVPVFTDTIWK